MLAVRSSDLQAGPCSCVPSWGGPWLPLRGAEQGRSGDPVTSSTCPACSESSLQMVAMARPGHEWLWGFGAAGSGCAGGWEPQCHADFCWDWIPAVCAGLSVVAALVSVCFQKFALWFLCVAAP